MSSRQLADWSQLERVNLRDQVVEAIRQAIIEGRFPPGAKLPSEHEIARTFGVSRSSVREAIRHLAAMGLVTSRQGAGAFVARPEPARAMDALVPAFVLSQPSVRHLLEVRQSVEPYTAALAALRATDADLEELATIVRTLDAQRGHGEAYARTDRLFHHRIALASGNPLFPRILDLVHALFMRELLMTVRLPGAMEESFAFHRRIFEAIRARDALAAEQAMRDHLKSVEAQVDRVEAEESLEHRE